MKDFNIEKVNFKFENFVGIYENIFSKEECDKSIELFESYNKVGLTYRRSESGNKNLLSMDDSSVDLYPSITELDWNFEFMQNFLQRYYEIAYPLYVHKYPMIQNYKKHVPRYMKIQKTERSEGFHTWHFEHNGEEDSSNRVLAWILYLNDVSNGGETEFLYQSIRIKPKAGTLILFPSGFTHSHRGNPPLSGTKYVATGWIEFCFTSQYQGELQIDIPKGLKSNPLSFQYD